MRKNIKYTALTVLAALCMTTFGCNETVVTNVNDYLTVPEGSVELTEMTQSGSTNENVGENEETNNDNNETSGDDSVKEEENEVTTDNEENKESKENEDNGDDIGSDEASKEESEADDDIDDEDNEEEKENVDVQSETEDGNDEDNETENENDVQDISEEQEELIVPDTFDVEFYARTYPDVVEVFGDSPEALYKHYLDYGLAEGRMASENADVIPESEDNGI